MMEREREQENEPQPRSDARDENRATQDKTSRPASDWREPLEVDLWPFGANGGSPHGWGGGRH